MADGRQGDGMAAFSQADLAEALLRHGGELSSAVAKNPKLLKSAFDLVKAAKSGSAAAGAAALAGGVSAGTQAAGAGRSAQANASAASFVASELNASLGLVKVAQLTSPAAGIAFVGATVVQKTGIAVSLAGGDEERAKCIGALMELAGSAAITAIGAPTGVLLALSAASLAVSSYNAYVSCAAPQQGKGAR